MNKKEVLNHLWTARWNLNKSIEILESSDNFQISEMLSDCESEVKEAQKLVLAENNKPEPDRPNNPMPIGFNKIKEPVFQVVKGVKFINRGNYRTSTGRFEGLVTHYTVSGNSPSNARGVVGWLAEQGYGCMVMDGAGVIYIPEGFDVFKSWGYHAGVSRWQGRDSVSDAFAGMEICCWGKGSSVGPFRESQGEANIIPGKYQQYTKEQEESYLNFCLWAKLKNPSFSFDKLVGHDELRAEAGRKGDKQDPGASLSMTMPKFRELVKAKWEEISK